MQMEAVRRAAVLGIVMVFANVATGKEHVVNGKHMGEIDIR